MSNVTTSDQRRAASRFRELLARYQEMELLIRLGEYKAGNDPLADAAVDLRPEQLRFLRQDTREQSLFKETVGQLRGMAA